MNPDQSERSGILAGGNWIVDRTKMIDVYPAQDSLANIIRETSSNGGCPFFVWLATPLRVQLAYVANADSNTVSRFTRATGAATTTLSRKPSQGSAQTSVRSK